MIEIVSVHESLALEMGFRVVETNHGVQMQHLTDEGIVRGCRTTWSQELKMWNKLLEQAREIEKLKAELKDYSKK
jgi:hypothetical protein